MTFQASPRAMTPRPCDEEVVCRQARRLLKPRDCSQKASTELTEDSTSVSEVSPWNPGDRALNRFRLPVYNKQLCDHTSHAVSTQAWRFCFKQWILVGKRRHDPTLHTLLRSTIFHQKGRNPSLGLHRTPRVEDLIPLPTSCRRSRHGSVP
ncbi:uncharacterized protein BT62DRAFT_1077569 [Guyanagaster necrorhizus]|uniref:Uncharacterized protein n=1 Tax=Guyanagaster necrorhizus TaxID=856835 RepID=A0A9P8ASF6_9AGAR|nr:uncharacterized protein BT62DRAFT_1077569 [Guyanagaster necrorhizus MCA 3950]KAG7444817.1 hypothetical protein BT62DRAFT_1077569 [Guyanagaster necrorhizus MCA 3950]